MGSVWNKGFTKETHESVRRISQTMRLRKVDNFEKWRNKARRSGLLKSEYAPLEKNEDLAELIGVILGDGHICAHARCESLRITGNFSNKEFTKRYATLTQRVFGKNPVVAKVKTTNAVTITIYEKHISTRLGIPSGNRSKLEYKLPIWIRKNKQYTLRFLRGLYEAEGSECHHEATFTHKLFFTNHNPSLLLLVAKLIQKLGFTTNIYKYNVQVSRKKEVQDLINLLEFRNYSL